MGVWYQTHGSSTMVGYDKKVPLHIASDNDPDE